nr:MAG TPA: hypothetical protein [Bacteriophage sp.]
MTNKEFAEKNAGKYFAFKRYKVRVVGYHEENNYEIIVSVPKKNAHDIGWSKLVMDEYDILLIPSRADRFWYVDIAELKIWK